jgi:cytochrome c553
MNSPQAALLTSSTINPLRYNILWYRKGEFMHFVLVSALILLMLSACAPSDSSTVTLQPGDAARGAQLFTESVNGAPACSTCHTLDGSTLVGPTLQGISATAQTRIVNTSAQDYIHDSILHPPAYIVSGFSNLMYNQYEQHLSPQQISDLVAYLLTL